VVLSPPAGVVFDLDVDEGEAQTPLGEVREVFSPRAADLTCVAVLTHATASALAGAHAALDDLTQVDRLGWSLPAPRA
jgi:hypothetical protein